MYKNTLLKDVKFRKGVKVTAEAKDFIKRLLEKNPKRRLGSIADSLEIMSHPWLSDFNWGKLIDKKLKPVYEPF